MSLTRETQLKTILTNELKLREPRFALQEFHSHLCGSVISETFARKGDYDRQMMIRTALERALGPTFQRKVGMILAYTPYEWDIDLDEVPVRRKAKAGK